MLSKEELLNRHVEAVLSVAQAADIADFSDSNLQQVVSSAKEFAILPAVHHLQIAMADSFLRHGGAEVMLIGQRVHDDPLTSSAEAIISSRSSSPKLRYVPERPRPTELDLSQGWSAVFAEDNGAAHFAVCRGCKTSEFPGLAVVSGYIGSILAVRAVAPSNLAGTVIPRG